MKTKKMAAALFLALCVTLIPGSQTFAATKSSQTDSDTCSTCHGEGKSTCTWCKGTGQMEAAGTKYTCGTCKGTGKMTCLGCAGKGTKSVGTAKSSDSSAKASTSQTTKPEAKSKGTVKGSASVPAATFYTESHAVCPICNGAGRRVCTSCSGFGFRESKQYSTNYGKGRSFYYAKTSCAACRGTGTVPCTSCGGDGIQ